MSEYVGRKWVCTCGWKGAREDAYDHVKDDCREEWPQVGPRYTPDRYRGGEQADLSEWGVV